MNKTFGGGGGGGGSVMVAVDVDGPASVDAAAGAGAGAATGAGADVLGSNKSMTCSDAGALDAMLSGVVASTCTSAVK